VVGTDSGEIFAHTARDSTAVGKDHPHASAVTAMDSGHVPATGAKLVVSASKAGSRVGLGHGSEVSQEIGISCNHLEPSCPFL